jgi:hypothetical protein
MKPNAQLAMLRLRINDCDIASNVDGDADRRGGRERPRPRISTAAPYRAKPMTGRYEEFVLAFVAGGGCFLNECSVRRDRCAWRARQTVCPSGQAPWLAQIEQSTAVDGLFHREPR